MSRDKLDQFVHLTPVGFIPALKNHRKEKEDSTTFSQYFTMFSAKYPEMEESLRKVCAHKMVGYSEERQRQQEKKFDAAPVEPNDSVADLATEFTYRMYQAALEAQLTIRPQVIGNKAPSFPYTAAGYATKADAMESDMHAELMKDKPDPIWKGTPKGGEPLSNEDLAEGKLRTFSQVAVYFALYQKFMFEDQNERMKAFHDNTWGKYGWVKQFGGFDRLMKKIARFATRLMGDVSGWDRKIFLRRVYELRKRGLKTRLGEIWNDQLESIFDWLASNTVEPMTSFVDGSVWIRHTGNCSGSNNTTTDNTLAHTIVFFDFLIKNFLDTHSRLPTYEEIVDFAEPAIFGDDLASGLDHDHFGFSSTEDLTAKMVAGYARWGLTLKPKAVVVDFNSSRPMEGIEFLGSTAVWKEDRYEPKPRLSKLIFSLMNKSEAGTFEAEVAKTIAIYDLLVPVYPEYAHIAQQYAEFLYNLARDENFSVINKADKSALERVIRGDRNACLSWGYEALTALAAPCSSDSERLCFSSWDFQESCW